MKRAHVSILKGLLAVPVFVLLGVLGAGGMIYEWARAKVVGPR